MSYIVLGPNGRHFGMYLDRESAEYSAERVCSSLNRNVSIMEFKPYIAIDGEITIFTEDDFSNTETATLKDEVLTGIVNKIIGSEGIISAYFPGYRRSAWSDDFLWLEVAKKAFRQNPTGDTLHQMAEGKFAWQSGCLKQRTSHWSLGQLAAYAKNFLRIRSWLSSELV